MAYAVGLTGYSVVKIASPTFYALGESRTPVLVSVLSVLTNAALNILFVREFGYRGLALGTSLTALLNAGLLMLLLRRRLDGLHLRHLASVLARVAVASLAMGLAAWGLDRQLHAWMPGHGPADSGGARGTCPSSARSWHSGSALTLLRVSEFTDVVTRSPRACAGRAPRTESCESLQIRTFVPVTRNRNRNWKWWYDPLPAMARYPSSGYRIAVGPGGMSPAIKALLIANTAMFVVTTVVPQAVAIDISRWFGLMPEAVVTQGRVWQPFTYMFLHADVFHILFNMLGAVDVRRRARADVGHAVLRALLRGHRDRGGAHHHGRVAAAAAAWADHMYASVTIGASGAIYGLLLAYGLSFPNRPIYLYFLFQVPAKYFVMIVGAVAFYSSVNSQAGGISHAAHLGGLVVGYCYLRGRRMSRWNPVAEVEVSLPALEDRACARSSTSSPARRSDDWDSARFTDVNSERRSCSVLDRRYAK